MTNPALKAKEGEVVPEGVTAVFAPRFDVSGVQILHAGNEFLMSFSHASFAHISGAPEGYAGIQGVPVVQLSVSPQTLKDLALLFSEQVSKYEEEWGPVETPYTRKLGRK